MSGSGGVVGVRSLGTAAFFNVSSSVGNDPNSIPTNAAVDAALVAAGAGDITAVNDTSLYSSANTGIKHTTQGTQVGGEYGQQGNIVLAIDTGSAHFQAGVELYSSDTTLPSGLVSGSSQITDGSGIVSGSITEQLPSGVVSGSSQVTSGASAAEVLSKSSLTDEIEGSGIFAGGNLWSIGTSTSNVGDLSSGNQLSLYGTSISGLTSFDISGTAKSFDYVSSDVRYIDTNAGVSIALKPDADATKSWVVDTDGDLVSNGGGWASGNAYMNNLIASSSVTASNMIITNDVIISGDLNVAGTTTYTSTNNVNIGDNIIELNFGGSATEGGILVKDATGTTTSGSLLWNSVSDSWTAGALGSESDIVTNSNFNSTRPSIAIFNTISGSNIHSEGTVTAEGDIVAYASSDERLKDEIIPISNPLEKINSIGGYSFVWNKEKQDIYNGKDYGVIAQEIEEILPELVDNRKDGYKAVKYDRLVSLLIEGIKELSAEVKELKEKINRE